MLGIDIHGLGAILWSFRSYDILCIVRLGDMCNQYLQFIMNWYVHVLPFTNGQKKEKKYIYYIYIWTDMYLHVHVLPFTNGQKKKKMKKIKMQ